MSAFETMSALQRHCVCVVKGSEISIFYDPMICKLIAHAPTRSKPRSCQLVHAC